MVQEFSEKVKQRFAVRVSIVLRDLLGKDTLFKIQARSLWHGQEKQCGVHSKAQSSVLDGPGVLEVKS